MAQEYVRDLILEIRNLIKKIESNSGSVTPGSATEATLQQIENNTDGLEGLLAAPIAVTGPLTDVQLRATPVPVSGTVTVTQATGTNLHTVVDSSALPTGASTSALQTTGNTSLSTLETNSNNNNRGTTITLSTITGAGITCINNGSQTLLASAALTARKGALVTNGTNFDVYLVFGANVASNTNYSIKLYTDDPYEIPDKFANAEIRISITENSVPTGIISVTTIN